MTMTQPTIFVSSDLVAFRAKKFPLYKDFALPLNLADVEALILNIPHRTSRAPEVRTIAKKLGAFFTKHKWFINRSKLEGALGQECLDTLNALRVVEGVKLIERQRVARNMGIKVIYLKVPYEQRSLASADGAQWVAHHAFRRWAFAVVPNDSAFSTLISKWEELGMVDADFTEEAAFIGISEKQSLEDAHAAKTLRPQSPTVQQFSATRSSVSLIDDEYAEYLFRQSIHNSPLILEGEKMFHSTTISLRSPIMQDMMYTLTIHYLNPLFSLCVPSICQENPSVLLYTHMWQDCPDGSKKSGGCDFSRGYYMEATQMRKFWDAAIVNKFVVEPTKDHQKKSMLQVISRNSEIENFVKPVAWGLLHDPVFTMGGFCRDSK